MWKAWMFSTDIGSLLRNKTRSFEDSRKRSKQLWRRQALIADKLSIVF
jgi:hypothetical protein